jgi:precorrin-2 dehydrogenase/sirohydrochlorin ferrochelatase
VQVLSGRGPVDLLTLRASRALSAADVLVADPGANPEILSMARRDAERRSPAETSGEALAEMARSGLRVVRVLAGPAPLAEVQALAAAGVAVEVLAVAPQG